MLIRAMEFSEIADDKKVFNRARAVDRRKGQIEVVAAMNSTKMAVRDHQGDMAGLNYIKKDYRRPLREPDFKLFDQTRNTLADSTLSPQSQVQALLFCAS